MIGGRSRATQARGIGLNERRTVARAWPSATALLAGMVLCALVAAYWALVFRPASLAYLDYVDGYYLYVSHRMAQGAVLYAHLMGVQPPGIYLIGDALFRLHDGLSTIRFYSAALHSLTVLLVFVTARRLFPHARAALLAATLYSLAPYSLIWSRTFDPNPLVTCLSLATLLALLGGTTRGAAIAGVLGAIALATKIWYLPVCLATLLFLAQRRRDLLAPYAVALGSSLLTVALLGTASAGAAFWRGLLVQDASGFSLSWLTAALFDVVQRDWPLLLLAGAGLSIARRTASGIHQFAPWYLLASLSVLGATIKVGTFAPVFQFAEPALALFAAVFLASCLDRGSDLGSRVSSEPRRDRPMDAIAQQGARSTRTGGPLLAGLILALLLLWGLPTLRDGQPPSDASVRTVVAQIERASAPNASLLAPPYYLYLAGRREIGEYADVNLWALSDARGDAAARALTRRAVHALQQRAVPLVLLDGRVARLPGVEAALHARYHRLPFRDPLPNDRAVSLWAP